VAENRARRPRQEAAADVPPGSALRPCVPPPPPQSAGVLPRAGGGREVLVGNTALTLKRDYMEVRAGRGQTAVKHGSNGSRNSGQPWRGRG
jgi:hypothetical protein